MTALIIDTSGPEGIVAVAENEKLTHTLLLPSGKDLSKKLFYSVQSLGEIKFDWIAVGKGPGTFTGTRVGATAAQALAFGWRIPLIPFSSSLLPDLPQIARFSYQAYQAGATSMQIELVYIPPPA